MRRLSQWTVMCLVIGSNLVFSNASPPDAACLPPWFRVFDQCFRTMNIHGSWYGVRGYCGDYEEGGTPGGDLAQPKDIKALTNALTSNGYNKDRDRYWLGGEKDYKTGNWLWNNGSLIATSPFPGAGWSRNEDGDPNPDIEHSEDQHCLVMNPNLGTNSLDDVKCDSGALPLCERPSGPAIYNCFDLFSDCADRKQDCSDNYWVKKNCKKTCKLCVTGTCPEGYWRIPGSRDSGCYKLFVDHRRTWEQSHSLCRHDGAHLAIPQDPVTLRFFLVERYDQHWAWLGGRGDDIEEPMVYVNGTELPNDSPYWFPGYPNSPAWTTHDYCLLMLVDWGHMGMGPDWTAGAESHGLFRRYSGNYHWTSKPYASFDCNHLYYALCEKPMFDF